MPAGGRSNWSATEDAKLTQLVNDLGQGRWSDIATHFPGRIGKQCRERWCNQLDPSIKTGKWTEEEEQALVAAHRRYSNRWSEIARELPGRPENSIKNHWNATLRRKDAPDGPLSVLKHYMRHELNIGWSTTNPNPFAGVATSGVFGSRPRRRKRAAAPVATSSPTAKNVVVVMPRDAAHVQALTEVGAWICQVEDAALTRFTASFALPSLPWEGLSDKEHRVHAWLQGDVCGGLRGACDAIDSIMLVVWWEHGNQGGVWLTLATGDGGVEPERVREAVAQMRVVVMQGLAKYLA